jgi:tellurite resistance-related uncharacterized protein
LSEFLSSETTATTEGSITTASASELPSGLEPYKQTPVFTELTIPGGLRKDHSTKLGVWGLIHVSEGQLRYTITDPRRAGTEVILTAECGPGVVEPTIVHHVEPLGPVQFHVQFYRKAGQAAPLCRHEELARRENQKRRQRCS